MNSGSGGGGTVIKEDVLKMNLKGLEREDLEDLVSSLLQLQFCQDCKLSLHAHLETLTTNNNIAKLMKKVLIEPTNSPQSDSSSMKSLGPSTNVNLTGSNSKRTPEHNYNSQSQKGYSEVSPFARSSLDTLFPSEGIPEEQDKIARVGRKKNFVHMEKVNGKNTNVLQGLELHTRVFDAEEQKRIVKFVFDLQRKGQKGQLRERTYTEPSKWMRGKGRVTIQFGCCYNYAVDKNGNPPGIIRDEEVDPLPPLFKQMIKRLVNWNVLPRTCIPNSCIVNIYDEGDCIPPHIDHHDFVRPFCTISFLSECNILFGGNLKILGPGEFLGPVSIPLPTGSVLVLNGNGADIAKHCVPAVPTKRISITFRKMDESKVPYGFQADPELQGIKHLRHDQLVESLSEQQRPLEVKQKQSRPSFTYSDDFPPLGTGNSGQRRGELVVKREDFG